DEQGCPNVVFHGRIHEFSRTFVFFLVDVFSADIITRIPSPSYLAIIGKGVRMPESQYMIRRKVLTLFGAQFHIYNAEGKVVGFSKQKAFKLKEDIRVYT